MPYHAAVEHEGGHVDLKVEGTVIPGSPGRMNPPGKAYPPEPPTVDIDNVEIEHDDLDRDLDPEYVFDMHDTEIVDQVIEEDKRRHVR